MAKRTPRTSDGGSSVGNGMGAQPEPTKPGRDTHDGAPAGETFSESELPVVPVHGGKPMSTGGVSYDSGNPSLPMDPHEGATRPPSGNRK